MTTELSAIARETHEKAVAYFKVAEQYGYKFIMEIKEIRDKQYYKALGFSSFDEYCEKSWKTIRKYMDERIQIAEAFGNEWNFESTYSQLGHSKSLILARMEPERRQEIMSKPQQLPDGSEKTVNEMTVNQLKELERRAKEAEERAARLESEARHWQGVAKSAQNQPPRVVTQTFKVVPEDYETLKQQAAKANELSIENVQLKRAINEIHEQYQEKMSHDDKRKAVNKDLKRYCTELIQQTALYTESILYNLSLNLGDREAMQLIESFHVQYSHDIQMFFNKLKEMTTIRVVK